MALLTKSQSVQKPRNLCVFTSSHFIIPKKRSPTATTPLLKGLKKILLNSQKELAINRIWIFGKHAVLEAARNKSRQVFEKVSFYDLPGFEKRPKEWFVKKFKDNANHQYTAALIEEFEPMEIEEAFRLPRVLILDQITDPHNLGAIIRSAAVFGFMGVIIMGRHSASITPVVYKTASGAMEHVKVITVTNISNAIKELKEAGFWVIGLDEKGTCALQDYKNLGPRPIALVIGAEGAGIRPLVKSSCDELLYIKSYGDFSTLNASNAACAAMYHFSSGHG